MQVTGPLADLKVLASRIRTPDQRLTEYMKEGWFEKYHRSRILRARELAYFFVVKSSISGIEKFQAYHPHIRELAFRRQLASIKH